MKFIFTLFTFIFFITLNGQTSFQEKVIIPLQQNNVPVEKIFIHTNKTFYFVDDVIWFKVYIGNRLNAPSLATTQLTVSLLDSKQHAVLSKSIFVHSGTGQGQFELNATLAPGKYTVQAYTENSLNFGETFIHNQEIIILGKLEATNISNKSKFDVQVFPEGGYLLEDTENTIGIKALKNGKGCGFSGKMLNSKNEVVQEFKEEHFGMARCKFWYDKNERYTVHLMINDTLVTTIVPSPRNSGVLLSTSFLRDSICITLKTNKETLNNEKKEYYLLSHQRNAINGFLRIEKLDNLTGSICSSDASFPEGVNTLTLFENNRPIAERKFFVEKTSHKIKTSIEKVGIEVDSIVHKITFNNDYSNQANFSISILPKGDKIFDEKQNIKSAFLLRPFIKGYIENPGYYFNEENLERKQHLDLLLLTQGWTGYGLDKMIESLDPVAKYDFKRGYRIKGKVGGSIKHPHLALISNKDELIDKIFLNGKKSFSFDNIIVHKGDTLKIAFIDSLNQITKLDNMQIDSMLPGIPRANFPLRKKEWIYNHLWDIQLEYDIMDIDGYTTGVLALDEVLITGKKINETFLKRRKVIKKLKPFVFDIGQYYEVPLPENFKNFNDDLMSFLNFDQQVTITNFQGVENYLKAPLGEALLFLNGKEITSERLPHLRVPMADVAHIMLKTIRGKDRIYQVFTSENHKRNVVELFNRYIARDGYDIAKKYYQPVYNFYESQPREWKEIDWKPTIKTNKKGEAIIKVYEDGPKEEHLFSIQGFTNEGLLISEILYH